MKNILKFVKKNKKGLSLDDITKKTTEEMRIYHFEGKGGSWKKTTYSITLSRILTRGTLTGYSAVIEGGTETTIEDRTLAGLKEQLKRMMIALYSWKTEEDIEDLEPLEMPLLEENFERGSEDNKLLSYFDSIEVEFREKDQRRGPFIAHIGGRFITGGKTEEELTRKLRELQDYFTGEKTVTVFEKIGWSPYRLAEGHLLETLISNIINGTTDNIEIPSSYLENPISRPKYVSSYYKTGRSLESFIGDISEREKDILTFARLVVSWKVGFIQDGYFKELVSAYKSTKAEDFNKELFIITMNPEELIVGDGTHRILALQEMLEKKNDYSTFTQLIDILKGIRIKKEKFNESYFTKKDLEILNIKGIDELPNIDKIETLFTQWGYLTGAEYKEKRKK